MLEATRRHRRALRSPWLAFSWFLGLVALLPAVSGFFVAEDVASAVFVGVIMGLPGLWVVLRVPFMRVTLSPRGIVYHGLWRNRTIARDTVAKVSVEPSEGGVGSAVVPVVLLKGGQSVELTFLSGYTASIANSRVSRQARLIDGHLGTSPLNPTV